MLLFFTQKVNLNLAIIWLCCFCWVCIIQLFQSHFIIISFESVGGGLFYMHSDMTMRMFGTMQKWNTLLYTHTHTCTGSGVWSMNSALHSLLSSDWTLERWWNSALVWAHESRLQSAILFSFCFLFAWAEKSNVHRSCLSWGFGWWGRVISARRHTQSQLGLSGATIGSARAFWLGHWDSKLCRMTFTADLKLEAPCHMFVKDGATDASFYSYFWIRLYYTW